MKRTTRTPFLRSLTDRTVDNLPLSAAAWLYNLRRVAKLLIPRSPYTLADRADSLSNQPLLFVSSGRAGTTLLRSMLVAGGDIAIPPESFAITAAALQFSAMQELGWYNLTRLVISLFEGIDAFQYWEIDLYPVYVQARSLPEDQRSLAKIIDLIFMHYASEHFPNAVLWGDQSPFNSRRLGWVRQIYPRGRYLHILRDGRDVVASYKQKGDGVEWAWDRWSVAVRSARELQSQLPAECFLEIRYEHLVTDPETTLRQVCTFADIPYKPVMLEYWKLPTTQEHQYRSFHQNLARPVFPTSIGRWKERLTPEEQTRTQEVLGGLLREMGYE